MDGESTLLTQTVYRKCVQKAEIWLTSQNNNSGRPSASTLLQFVTELHCNRRNGLSEKGVWSRNDHAICEESFKITRIIREKTESKAFDDSPIPEASARFRST